MIVDLATSILVSKQIFFASAHKRLAASSPSPTMEMLFCCVAFGRSWHVAKVSRMVGLVEVERITDIAGDLFLARKFSDRYF